jgi:hypothetical protein
MLDARRTPLRTLCPRSDPPRGTRLTESGVAGRVPRRRKTLFERARLAEHNRAVLRMGGRAGFIVPTGIATDDGRSQIGATARRSPGFPSRWLMGVSAETEERVLDVQSCKFFFDVVGGAVPWSPSAAEGVFCTTVYATGRPLRPTASDACCRLKWADRGTSLWCSRLE